MKKIKEDKKVKKYKVLLIGLITLLLTAVTLFFLLCSSDITKRQNKENNITEQEQLVDMSEYIDRMDKIISSYRQELKEISIFDSQNSMTMMEYGNVLSDLTENVQTVNHYIKNYKGVFNQTNKKHADALLSLYSSEEKIKELIAKVENSIKVIPIDIKASNEEFSKLSNQYDALKTNLEEVKKETEEYTKELTKLITLLQDNFEENQEEVLKILIQSKNNLSEIVNTEIFTLQTELGQGFENVLHKLNALQRQINQTKDEISECTELIDSESKEHRQEISAFIISVKEAIEQIKNDYAEAYAEIRDLIEKLRHTETKNHEEIITVLSAVADNMEKSSDDSLSYLTSSIENVEQSVNHSIVDMQNKLSEDFSKHNSVMGDALSQYQNSMTESLNQINSSMTNQYQALTDTVNAYGDNQQNLINTLTDIINEKLESVFTYVSNGKRKLASALLTKGITVREDASFDLIYKAILDIPQKIEVQEMSGAISYEYHYHENSCYKICPGTLKHYDTVEHKNGVKDKYFRCSVCGRTWVTAQKNDYADRPCNLKTVICNMVDGQILSATIIFDKSKQSQVPVSIFNLSDDISTVSGNILSSDESNK